MALLSLLALSGMSFGGALAFFQCLDSHYVICIIYYNLFFSSNLMEEMQREEDVTVGCATLCPEIRS